MNQSARAWIWASLVVQCSGYLVDIVWHGLLSPGVEPTTVGEMGRHLATVHLPLYLGATSVLVSTGTAFLRERRRGAPNRALSIAVAGAVLSAGAEAWHAASHLRLDTHTAPIAGILSVVGFLVVVLAISLSGRRRQRAAGARDDRRAA
jgi:hypothetical protein